MKRSEILESNDQYVSMWKVLAGERKGADLRDKAGLSVCWADSPFPFLNALFINENISDSDLLRVRLRMSRTYMLAKQHSGLVYVCEDLLSGAAREELGAIAASENLTFALDITGMAGDILPLQAGLPHPVLDFARVDSETALQAYADINSEGYGFPLEAGRAGLAGSTFWKKVAFAYIGYLNGQPSRPRRRSSTTARSISRSWRRGPTRNAMGSARPRSAVRSVRRTMQPESGGPSFTLPTRACPFI
ncbi:hypothetical protein RW095_22705 [Paraburkholderia kirstenboschensis]|uniref:Uncharacterized protein n=1 Tax=Paraburkholderia kirstenboschensis TaxID=1245436 RepID=A0ABZ0EPH1_9BURK|nr:hypothetical protein [Paraburkholderia kirstenboschensis]WOD19078.1 hypothetical protein RW095_22705 [Paraburkholderia kirstenboschensis]